MDKIEVALDEQSKKKYTEISIHYSEKLHEFNAQLKRLMLSTIKSFDLLEEFIDNDDMKYDDLKSKMIDTNKNCSEGKEKDVEHNIKVRLKLNSDSDDWEVNPQVPMKIDPDEDVLPVEEKPVKNFNEAASVFTCGECDFTTKHKSLLVEHYEDMHGSPTKKSNVKSEQMIGGKGTLKTGREFKCEQCGKVFAFKQSMDTHILTKHQKIFPHKCDQCTYMTADKQHLKMHLKRIHYQIKDFQCLWQTFDEFGVAQTCSYAFSGQGELKRHVKAVHDKIKDAVCDDCGFATSEKADLKKHMQTKHPEIAVI